MGRAARSVSKGKSAKTAISYLRGLAPENQLLLHNRVHDYNDFEQKRYVYSIEGDKRFNRRWDLAFKASMRRGEMRAWGRDTDGRTGESSSWISSGAEFYALRLNYFVNKNWDAFVEYRTLSVDQAETDKSGWLLGVYKKFDDHAKVGIGYNFTDYNDDLTRLNYRSRGYFLNVIGEW